MSRAGFKLVIRISYTYSKGLMWSLCRRQLHTNFINSKVLREGVHCILWTISSVHRQAISSSGYIQKCHGQTTLLLLTLIVFEV